jgi:thiamine-monophosphate kinase
MGGPGELLADLGEWELLRRLAAFAPEGQFDDDAALLSETSGRQLVVNTDVLVEGLHFSEATMEPADLGWRAAAANLSDLAAMGCRTVVGLTVGLVAPASTPWRWVEGVYGGLHQALQRYGGTLLGGDCSGGAQRLLAITALGHLSRGPIHRSSGRPGDLLVSTGPHGLSRLGLALLLGELAPDAVTQALGARAIEAHRRPLPRFDAVEALERSQPKGQPWRVAGTDSSDGLVAAVASIARASGCQALLDHGALPLDAELAGLPQGETWCLAGGEDFELVLALDPGWAKALVAALPGANLLGTLAAGQGVAWRQGNRPFPSTCAGFTHFR